MAWPAQHRASRVAGADEQTQAYELNKLPELLYNLYSVHERAGHLATAADYLDRYLTSGAEIDARDLAWRFQMPPGATEITAAGFHGLHNPEVFVGVLPLTGAMGTPGAPPPQSSFLRIAGCGLSSVGAQDVQLGFETPVAVLPGAWYAVVVGTGRYGVGMSGGSAMVTRSTVPADPGMFDIEVGVATSPHTFAARLFVDYR